MTQLKTRAATGKPSWPVILLAGEAKTGKTHRAAEFTGDERVGRAYFLDLGEGSADEYIEVPGADYEVIDHDGTWVDIIGQVEAVRDVAAAELAANRPPVCLVIDSMTAEWAMLSQWADKRARRSKNNKRLLADDPDAEIDITSNYWNDATSRHNQLMNICKTFPGIVILTALETEKTQFGAGGKPLEGAPKVAKPDAQKRLSADVTVWVRLSLSEEPVVVGMRSVKRAIVPGKDKPQPWKDFTIGKLVFDFLGLGGDTAQVRNVPKLDADQVMANEDVPKDERKENQLTSAEKPATALLRAASLERARWFKGKVDDNGDGGLDATPFVTQDDREALGDRLPDGKVTLGQLAAAVVGYWEKHGRGPRDETPAADAPAEPAEKATSGEEAALAPS